jgi:hypothetical protein
MSYISNTHQRISDQFSNRDILTNPEKYFGPNYKILLNFWIIRENPQASCNMESSYCYDYLLGEAEKVGEIDIVSWCSGGI